MSSRRRFILFEVVEENKSSGLVVFIIACIIAAFVVLNDPGPTTDPNQTAFPLADVECSYGSYGPYLSDYEMGWRIGVNSDSVSCKGKYMRLTGTIGVPSTSGKSVMEYFQNNDLPNGAAPDFAWKLYNTTAEAEAATAALRSEMTATILSELQTITTEEKTFVLEIYGDGNLLFTSPCLLDSTEPLDFTINVEGVDTVEFKWSNAFIQYGADWFGNSSVTITNLTGHTD